MEGNDVGEALFRWLLSSSPSSSRGSKERRVVGVGDIFFWRVDDRCVDERWSIFRRDAEYHDSRFDLI